MSNNPTGKGGFGDNPQNRNNDGRPEGISITRMVKEALEEIEPKTEKPWKELIIKRILLKATNDGDTQMIKAIWSYIDGMPKQTTDLRVKELPVPLLQGAFDVPSNDSPKEAE